MRGRAVSLVLIVGGAIVSWHLLVIAGDVPVYIVPGPLDVLDAFGDELGGLARAAGVTLFEALAGLLIGSVAGITLAVVITFWGHLEQGLMSLALLVKSTPIIAIAPILTIWMGFGAGPKVAVTALLTFFPVLINSLEGFRSVDVAMLDWARSIDAPRREVFVQLRWPSARPFLFAALKVVAPLSLIGAVVAEWVGASSGLGRHMWVAYTNLDMPSLFAAVLALAAMSALIFWAADMAERKGVPWEASQANA
ncbi:MAG TPA: ABC transporter permease [Acidimicrobiia bacterium]|nr:ABC transporter permease [Acidimicrobiia bacterium]